MKDLVKICLDIISYAQSKDLLYDWEYEQYTINFEKNSNKYEIRFERYFFGFMSEIRLSENNDTISECDLTRQEFKMLKKAFIDREDVLKDLKFKKAFSEIQRDRKINQIIN